MDGLGFRCQRCARPPRPPGQPAHGSTSPSVDSGGSEGDSGGAHRQRRKKLDELYAGCEFDGLWLSKECGVSARMSDWLRVLQIRGSFVRLGDGHEASLIQQGDMVLLVGGELRLE